jgi:hypothetical protein
LLFFHPLEPIISCTVYCWQASTQQKVMACWKI